MAADEVVVDEVPKCQMCDRPAVVDCKMVGGPWAYLCNTHWHEHGMHYPDLGTGKGQRLVRGA